MNKPLRLIELFAGYGSQALALKYLGIPYENWFVCDFDKYAIQSYNDIHNTNYLPLDIKKVTAKDMNIVDTKNHTYLLTYSFPCTDLSVAGRQEGMTKGSGTRSGLLWEVERLLKECEELPQYLLMENVPQVIGKKNINDFKDWCLFLTKLGYTNSYELLNAKDYGIPQNRERCFMISVLGGKKFKFPSGVPLKLRLKDMLEDVVDSKYMVSNALMKYYNNKVAQGWRKEIPLDNKEVSTTICNPARNNINDTFVRCLQVGELDIKGQDNIKRVYSQEGLSPALTSMQGGNRQPKIITHIVPQSVSIRKYVVDIEKLKEVLRVAKAQMNITNSRIAFELNVPITKVEHWFRNDDYFAIPDNDIWFDLKHLLNITTNEFDKSIMTFEEKPGIYDKSNRVYDADGLSPTLTCQEEKILVEDNKTSNVKLKSLAKIDTIGYIPKGENGESHQSNMVYGQDGIARALNACDYKAPMKILSNNYKIRKLTPRECLRLMGVHDEDIDKMTVSNTQLYKQAGNSIVVDVMMAIFKNLFIDKKYENTLF